MDFNIKLYYWKCFRCLLHLTHTLSVRPFVDACTNVCVWVFQAFVLDCVFYFFFADAAIIVQITMEADTCEQRTKIPSQFKILHTHSHSLYCTNNSINVMDNTREYTRWWWWDGESKSSILYVCFILAPSLGNVMRNIRYALYTNIPKYTIHKYINKNGQKFDRCSKLK